jgi:hypothetical protein
MSQSNAQLSGSLRHAADYDADGGLGFLMRAANGEGRIVSSGDLTTLQVADAQSNGRFYVASSGFGWALVPWDLDTPKDRQRSQSRIVQ